MGLRPDQLAIMQDLIENLGDVFIEEADPRNWSGSGVPMSAMTQEQRGNRHWDRKGAMGTGGVLRFAMDVINRAKVEGGAAMTEGEDDLEVQVREAQKRASAAILRVVDSNKRAEFLDRAVRVRKG